MRTAVIRSMGSAGYEVLLSFNGFLVTTVYAPDLKMAQDFERDWLTHDGDEN